MADILQPAAVGGGPQETLADRLSQGPLPLGYALQCATDVANSLRELHQVGQLHGSVSTDCVLINATGATLLPPNGKARHTVAGADVSAFGALLYEVLTGVKPSPLITPLVQSVGSSQTESDIKAAAISLAAKCLRPSSDLNLDMQRVHMEIRLLSLQAKINQRYLPVNTREQDQPQLFAPVGPAIAADNTEKPAYTPVPVSGFMATSVSEGVEPVASGVRCPFCGALCVYPSRRNTWFEDILAFLGNPPLRCHRCMHRYVVFLSLFRFSKGSSNRVDRASP